MSDMGYWEKYIDKINNATHTYYQLSILWAYDVSWFSKSWQQCNFSDIVLLSTNNMFRNAIVMQLRYSLP